jgi:S1-C subfamily serine protease
MQPPLTKLGNSSNCQNRRLSARKSERTAVRVIQSPGLDSVQTDALRDSPDRQGPARLVWFAAALFWSLLPLDNLAAQSRTPEAAPVTSAQRSPPSTPATEPSRPPATSTTFDDSDPGAGKGPELSHGIVPGPEESSDFHGAEGSTWTGHLYDTTRESIVLVRAGGSEGTGFVFLNNRTVATALHVIEGTTTPEVVLSNGEELSAKVIAWDEDWDLAILQLPKPVTAPPLHVVTEGQVTVGDLVATLGNPWGAEQRKLPNSTAPVWALSHGIISAPPGDLIQTDAPVNPGNSGGPLLTTSGRVVGVLVVRVEGSDGISFAVGAKRLIELATRIGQQPAYEVAAWHIDAELYWLPLGEYSLSGLSVGGRLVHASGLGLAVRGGRLWGARVVESVLAHQRRNRWLGEAELRYYFADSESFALAVGAGVALSWDAVKDYTAGISDGGQITQQTRLASEDMVRGLFGVSIDTEVVSLHTGVYAFGGDTGGRLGIGFVF